MGHLWDVCCELTEEIGSYYNGATPCCVNKCEIWSQTLTAWRQLTYPVGEKHHNALNIVLKTTCLMISVSGLTHWGWVTHICIDNLTIIGSDNGLSPDRRQAIIWTNAGILLIWPLGTNFSEISIEIDIFSLKKNENVVCKMVLLDDIMTWKCFQHYWPFVRRILGSLMDWFYWSLVYSFQKGLMMWWFDVFIIVGLTLLLNKL